MDFITGEKFIQLSNFIYEGECNYDNYYNLINTFDIDIINNFNDDVYLYCHTHMVQSLFQKLKYINKKITLITHNSDVNVIETEIPDCINHWYAQNVAFNNNLITSIPIGLENSIWFQWIAKPTQIENKAKEQKVIKNLLYVNHNINTNVSERSLPYTLLKDKPWATVIYGSNGIAFSEYVDNIYNHKFVLCPPGNGIDTHRLWECLYLNTIPIVKNNINNRFYLNLPIILIDSYEQLTEQFLNDEYSRLTNINWNLDILNFSYWQNIIKNKNV